MGHKVFVVKGLLQLNLINNMIIFFQNTYKDTS